MKKLSILVFLMATSCGVQSSSELHIIGGQTAPNDKNVKGVYPATIGILTVANGQQCTGTRIGRTTFITAAHCFKGVNMKQALCFMQAIVKGLIL